MEVSLISPANYMYSQKGIFPKVLRYAPLTLTTLAGAVSEWDPEARINLIDEGLRDCPTDLESDLICISAITGTAKRSYAIADFYRQRGKRVILGGVHPTLLPKEAKEHADAIVTGMNSEVFFDALDDFSNGNLKEEYISMRGDLGKHIAPRRDLLKRFSYATKGSLQITYGCDNVCDFCVIPNMQGRHQKRNLDEVINDLEKISGPFVSIVDPNLTEDEEYAKELFKRMKPLNKKWGGLGTVEVGENLEMLDLMAESGCKGILIGFESVSQGSNLSFNKGINNVSKYSQVVKNVHDRGIAINGTFMFGSDGDTLNSFDETFNFVNEVGIDLPRYSIYTPFPNTPAFRRLKNEGRVNESDWALFDAQHVVFEPKNMSPEELREGAVSTWEKTYSINSIRKRLTASGCSPAISFLTNLGYGKYARGLRKFNNETILELESKRNEAFING
jgi:radical SAM superfamily enzyme YgiQ (UPF0313 family)